MKPTLDMFPVINDATAEAHSKSHVFCSASQAVQSPRLAVFGASCDSKPLFVLRVLMFSDLEALQRMLVLVRVLWMLDFALLFLI